MLLFSGTLPADPDYWQSVFDVPAHVEELILINKGTADATVQVAKNIDGHGIIIFPDSFDGYTSDDVIPSGEAVKIDSFDLYTGQAVEIKTDQELDYYGYGELRYTKDPIRDTWFDCSRIGNLRNPDGLIINVELGGRLACTKVTAEGFDVGCSIGAKVMPDTIFVVPDSPAFGIELAISGEAFAKLPEAPWIAWSKIGQLNFKHDLVGDAGQLVLPWRGVVYKILRLSKNAVIYGSGGITLLFPVKDPLPTFGTRAVTNIGIKNRTAVAGDEHTHFFIDARNRLWKFNEEGLSKLGYDEFMESLTDPILTYNHYKGFLLINDNENGFMLTADGLGGGYPGTSGILLTSNETRLARSSIGLAKPLNLSTDIIDFGYRGLKTIQSIQFGIDAGDDYPAYAAIDYRYKTADSFSSTDWVPLTIEGVGFPIISGVEFRFKLKRNQHGSCRVSYINIQYKRTDLRYVRGPMGASHARDTVTAQ